MSSTAATTTTTDARTRSLELAHAKGHTNCSHAAKTLGWALDEQGELVSLALEIRSAIHAETTTYAVGYLASSDDAACDCPAAQHGKACHHRGLAIMMGREVKRLYAPQGRREAERENYLAWINESPTALIADGANEC